MIRICSLFDGSGGFPLAGVMCGMTPMYAAEVEPYPIAVTHSRFPEMIHLGDVSEVRGDAIDPVDIITFGSPCQDLSVAGKRAGLKHEDNGDDETTRSGLFMEAVRIIKEMRKATNGIYPRFAVWENVPGAFSSNKGEDFRIVLEELIKICEPSAVMPGVPEKGWAYADSYRGDRWSLSYRVFDAQYWGVPQRRRRIYLVADFRGERARKILFERESLRGYSATGGTPWQTAAGNAENCPAADDREGNGLAVAYSVQDRAGKPGGHKGMLVQKDRATSLGTANYQYIFQPVLMDAYQHHGWRENDVTGTLTAGQNDSIRGDTPLVLEQYLFENHSQDSKCRGPLEVCQMIYAQLGTGGNNTPFVVGKSACIPINDKATRYRGGGADRKNDGAGNGLGVGRDGDPSPTLTSCDRHAVAYCTDVSFFNSIKETAPTLLAKTYKDPPLVSFKQSPVRYIVRRFTPTECARLQGFPDRWGHPDRKTEFTDAELKFWTDVRNTHAEINGKVAKEYTAAQMLTWYNKLHTDSAEYKMWGNGIALPTALYVMQGIEDALKEDEE